MYAFYEGVGYFGPTFSIMNTDMFSVRESLYILYTSYRVVS